MDVLKMDRLKYLLELLVAVNIAVRYPSPTVNIHTDKVCTVYIKHLSNPEPVFLDRDNKLWYPNGPALVWKGGESTLIACPGNEIVDSGTATASITCFAGTIFTINGLIDAVNILNVKCKDRPKGSVRYALQPCGDVYGTLLDVGFEVLGVGFVPYFESCYDMVKASVIYTRHRIDGAAIYHKIRITPGERQDLFFNDAEVPQGLEPQTSYLQRSQVSRFTQLLGSQTRAESYIFDQSYLSRGHLTPYADGIFRSWRWATYFFVNAAPQWRVTNAGNWEEVEQAARDVSARLQKEVLVFTGTHDTLTLPHIDGRQVEITLKDDKIQAPKWFWKIIMSPSKDAAIALVSHNNPHRELSPWEMLCDDICAQHGWSNANYSYYELGYTYCCKVTDLRQAIHSIPTEAVAYEVLRYDGTIGSANGPGH